MKQKHFHLLFASLIMLNLFCSNKTKENNYFYSWVEGARIRKTPGFGKDIIGKLKEGEKVIFTGEKSKETAKITLREKGFNTPFYKVKLEDGSFGWVYGGALQTEKPIFQTKKVTPQDAYMSYKEYEKDNTKYSYAFGNYNLYYYDTIKDYNHFTILSIDDFGFKKGKIVKKELVDGMNDYHVEGSLVLYSRGIIEITDPCTAEAKTSYILIIPIEESLLV